MVVTVFVVAAALVLLGAAMVLTGRWDPGLSGADRAPAPELPADGWRSSDVEGLHFRVGLRGYRMEDVDAALAALAADLRSREGGVTGADRTDPPANASEG